MEIIQNKFTESLKAHELYVWKGWNERLATQLAYEQLHTDGPALHMQVDKLHQWYEDNNVLAYSLGWRASLAAFAHFTLVDPPYTTSFETQVHTPHLNDNAAFDFLKAVHYDLMTEHQQFGDVYSRVNEYDVSKISLLQKVGYQRITEFGRNVLLLRKGVDNY